MSCIVIDIGNTSTAIGLAKGMRVSRVQHLKGGLSDRKRIAEVVSEISRGRRLEGAALASVVPRSNRAWTDTLCQDLDIKPLVVSHTVELGIGIKYPKPARIGADRLANSTAAAAKYGAPVIVADFGTALTFDVVSGDGDYVGGVIAPGLPLMTDYLHEKTALLPSVRLQGKCPAVGKSTEGAMRIGARVGYRGMVREIIGHLLEQTGVERASLCATGGYARWALKDLDMPFTIDPDLTLAGLGRIYELNQR